MSFRDTGNPPRLGQCGHRQSGQRLVFWALTALPLHCAPSSRAEELAGQQERVVQMPKRRQLKEPQEPIGIVISGGPHEDPTPKLTAYVYSIEDETSGEPIDVKAA